jgi:hypothetical protein
MLIEREREMLRAQPEMSALFLGAHIRLGDHLSRDRETRIEHTRTGDQP